MLFSNVAFYPTAFCACVAPTAPRRSSSPSPVSGAGFAPPAGRGAGWRRLPTGSIASSPGCPFANVRVVRDVAAPDPHRPERAQLTHSVPRGTASLTTLCSHGQCADAVKESGVEYEQRFPT